MARKSKKKRKKGRSINWPAVLWTVLVLNIAVGLMYSPLTSIRRMRILGVQPHDTDRLKSLSAELNGLPYMSVPVTRFEGQILGSRDVMSAELSHNLFGSAILTLQYRQPVATLVDSPHTYLDNDGVIFGSPEPYPGLRKLTLDAEYMQPGLALTLPWPSQLVAELCTKLNSFEQLKADVIHVDTTGRLTIDGEGGYKIDLGGTDQIDEKLRKLGRMLEEDPAFLTKLRSLSLVDPARPALIGRTAK